MTAPAAAVPAVAAPQRFSQTLHAEWVKFWSVRSTVWSVLALVGLGVGLTALVCALTANGLAAGEVDDPPGAFITWGMAIAQIAAIVLGALVVTNEYATGMIRSTLTATPRRGAVLVAKCVVLGGTLFVAGTFTALAGYFAGNSFLAAEGVGLSLTDDGVFRSLYGSGLYVAALGLLSAGVGLLVKHTAAALSIVLGTVFVVGNMAMLLPGSWGDWISRLMPGNAGSSLATPVPFNPNLLDPWQGFAVLSAEAALLLLVGYARFRRRDA